MINLDPYIVDFVANNWIALTILLTVIKGIAMLTESTKDDKICTMLTNLFGTLRSGGGKK